MPIEIRELVIRVNLEETTRKPVADPKELQDLKNRLIRECMDKILVKLDNLSER